jgi:hypothetical protein
MDLKRFIQYLSVVLLFLMKGSVILYAQVLNEAQTNGSRFNSIRTAVPFLLITPDARTGAMGEVGAAVAPDASSMSSNPSRIAFLEQQSGFSVSYSPWLKNIASDINLGYLSGFYQIDDKSTLGAALRYFSLGKIQLRDVNQQDLGIFSPSELAVDVTYARRFGETFSLGTSLRYIHSNIATNKFSAGQDNRAGQAVAVDVSAYFKKPGYLLGHDAILSAGINISNIGTKMSYSNVGQQYFLPANLKIGGAGTFILDDENEITVAVDFNKLLVPTQPLYTPDGTILSGKDPERSVPSGIFDSFSDAPGGAGEELKEINIASGLEYWYNKRFALRAGYFYENPQKGDRRYFTMGTGIRYNVMELNFSYLLASSQNSPLANTLRFSVLFNFGDAGL